MRLACYQICSKQPVKLQAMARKKKRPEDSAPDTVAEVFAGLSRACMPPPSVDPIQWLENVRWLSPESSREIGPFRFDRAKYLIEMQRACLDPDVSEVVICSASQIGKTELLINSLLYWSSHSPGPALI